jgi:hypothetical protein
MSYGFGSGILWGTPVQDAKGTAISNPTPLIFGTLQDMELDFKFELKKLHGQNQLAVAVGRGKGDITGKIKVADIRMGFLETIIFGQAAANGVLAMVNDTQGAAVPSGAPYTVAPTVPDSGTFDKDLGVIDVSTGRELKRVATPTAANEYAVSAGVYTFAAASAGKALYFNFRYTSTSTATKTLTIRNLPMGYAPTFAVDYYAPFQGKAAVMSLNSCVADGWKWGAKNDDFTVPEIGFSVQADASGVIGKISFTE